MHKETDALTHIYRYAMQYGKDKGSSAKAGSKRTCQEFPLFTLIINIYYILYIYINNHSIADIEDSENSQSQSSLEMYSPSITETQDEMSIVGRKIQLTRTIQQVMQHLNKEVEGQLLRRPHVRMEN